MKQHERQQHRRRKPDCEVVKRGNKKQKK